MTQAIPPTPDDTPSLSEGMKAFVAHLIELRDRLVRAVLAIIVLMLALFPWTRELFTIFATPVLQSLPEGQTMIATGAISPFFVPVVLAALAAVFVAMPYILYQLWAFIAPGLYQHEKNLALPLIVSSSVLFYVGAGFAYFVVIPTLFHFMAMFAPQGVSFMPDIGSYLDLVISLFFTFGLAFEVPVAVVLLCVIGVVTPDQLAEKRRYAILVAAIIGAIFTPPDVISMGMLAIPVWMLYELGILVARIMVKNKSKNQDEDDGETAEASPALTAPLAATALPAGAAALGELSADEISAAPPAAESPLADNAQLQDPHTDTDEQPTEDDDEFARAEEDERRLNAGEALQSEQDPGMNHASETKDADDDSALIRRDDRNTPLQDPSLLSAQDGDGDDLSSKPHS
ncbi:MAG: twin-arginine translocase subunit TatC [Pseudomonadota bacterium]